MHIIGTGRRNLAKLLATGQLTSYGSGTGVDDGALKKGIVKRYTILTLGRYSGTTNITINSKTDVHSNNCVFDDHTGLMWSRYVSASVGPTSNGQLPWTTTGVGGTAEGIFEYMAAANAASLGGYTDWRIPNLSEVFGLLDYEAPTAYPNSIAFPSMQTTVHSSTTRVADTTNSMLVGVSTGAFSYSLKTATNYVLLVRP